MKCVTFSTRQFFRFAAVVMALVILWRNKTYNDAWLTGVALITMAVDGTLFIDNNKECSDG